MIGEDNSVIFSIQLSDLKIPLETRIPLAPRSKADLTSSPVTIPAPQITETSESILDIEFTESVIIFGFALDTAIPEPINSGGSIAIKLGEKEANDEASFESLAHKTETMLQSFKRGIESRITGKGIRCSL